MQAPQALQDFWQQRNARERIMLCVLSALVILLLWYTVLWEPLRARETQLERNIAANEADLAWLQAAAVQYTSAEPGTVTTQGTKQSLLAVTDLAAKSARLTQEMGNAMNVTTNTVRISFDDAPYDQLLKFIYQLQNRYGVSVTNLLLDKQKAEGLVDARLTLTRPENRP